MIARDVIFDELNTNLSRPQLLDSGNQDELINEFENQQKPINNEIGSDVKKQVKDN